MDIFKGQNNIGFGEKLAYHVACKRHDKNGFS